MVFNELLDIGHLCFISVAMDLFNEKDSIYSNLDEDSNILIALACIFKAFFKSQVDELINLIAFFPAEHEYIIQCFPECPDHLKFLCEMSKNHSKWLFLVNNNAEDNNFNAMHALSSSKGIYVTPIYKLELILSQVSIFQPSLMPAKQCRQWKWKKTILFVIHGLSQNMVYIMATRNMNW